MTGNDNAIELRNFANKESDMLYAIKAIAILSVVAAHMAFDLVYDVNITVLADRILELFGTIGVVCFFMISGYLFERKMNKGTGFNKKIWTNPFWIQKFHNIIIPWIFCGSLVYFLGVLTGKRVFLIQTWIGWLIGYYTYLYYLTILFVLYVIFSLIKNNIFIYINILLLGFISIILTTLGLLNGFLFTPYLNFLNWIAFFAIGILAEKNQWFKYIFIKLREKGFRNSIIILFTIITIVSVILPIHLGYWGHLSIITEFIGVLFCIVLSIKIAENRLFIDIGKKSFSIYLLHMPIAGVINTRMPMIGVAIVFKPLIALFVTYLVIVFIKIILNKAKMNNLLCLIGIKT